MNPLRVGRIRTRWGTEVYTRLYLPGGRVFGLNFWWRRGRPHFWWRWWGAFPSD